MNTNRDKLAATHANCGIEKAGTTVKSHYYFISRILMHRIIPAKSIYPDLLSSFFVDVRQALDTI